jgi:hypothetical protein
MVSKNEFGTINGTLETHKINLMGFNFENHGLNGIYKHTVMYQQSHRFLCAAGIKFSFSVKRI